MQEAIINELRKFNIIENKSRTNISFDVVPGATGADEKQLENKDSDNTDKYDKLLSSLKLKDEEVELLKKNESLFSVLTSTIEQKRNANAEAKKYREHIEKIEAEKKKKEAEDLAKKGEYEKLYNNLLNEVKEKDTKLKDYKLDSEIKMLAVKNKIKKDEYLKLFDKSGLEISEDGTIKDLEAKFEQFKNDNLVLFGSAEEKKITPDNSKPAMVGNLQNINLEELEKRAVKTQDKMDLALLLMKKREINKK